MSEEGSRGEGDKKRHILQLPTNQSEGGDILKGLRARRKVKERQNEGRDQRKRKGAVDGNNVHLSIV